MLGTRLHRIISVFRERGRLAEGPGLRRKADAPDRRPQHPLSQCQYIIQKQIFILIISAILLI